jgi:hypothetical protein
MKLVSIAAVAFLCVLASSMAQAPRMINYQGRLVSNGVPVDGPVNLEFKLYPTNAGGSTVYSFTTNSVPAANGLYSVMIGDTNSTDLLNALTNSSLYLEVWAYGTNLSPRTQLASVPYALKAEELTGSGATNWIDTTTFNATNALKVDTSTFNATNELKTDVSVFNATNALKVDTTTFNATNALKVDTSTFNATNELKTDVSVFNATNALKVDATTFNATNALKLDKAGGVLTGELIVSNNVTITSNLYVTGFITNATYYGNGVGITNLNAGNLAAGTVATAVDGSAITNLSAAQLKAGTVLLAVDGSAVTNISAANLTAGTVATAIDGSEVTNLSAAQLKAGTVLLAVDGSAVTNMNASELKSGTIANARIVNLPASSLAAGSIAAAIDGSAITNLAGEKIASGDIASDRMTVNAVVVSDFTAAGVVLAGSGAGTFTGVNGWSGVVTNRSTLGTNTIYIYHGIVTNVVETP